MRGGGIGGEIIYKTLKILCSHFKNTTLTLKVYLLLCCLSESDVDFQFGNIYDNGGMKHLNKIQHKQEHIG